MASKFGVYIFVRWIFRMPAAIPRKRLLLRLLSSKIASTHQKQPDAKLGFFGWAINSFIHHFFGWFGGRYTII